MVKDNTLIMLGIAAALTALALVEPSLREVATGALIGLSGGHLNGSQQATKAAKAQSTPST